MHPGRGDGTFSAPSQTGPIATATEVAPLRFNADDFSEAAVVGANRITVLFNPIGAFLGMDTVQIGNGGSDVLFLIGVARRKNIVAAVLLLFAGCDGVFGLVPVKGRTDAGGDRDGDSTMADARACTSVPFSNPRDYPVGMLALGIAAGHLNNDQDLDLVTANQGSHTLSVLLGVGGGGFQPAEPVPTANGPTGVAIVDVDDNQKLDLVVASFNGNAFSVHLGRGDGTFDPRTEQNFTSATEVMPFSYDPDPYPEVAVVGANQLTFMSNTAGTLMATSNLVIGDGAVDVEMADIGGDDQPDCVTVSSTAGTLGISLRMSSGFSAPTALVVPMRPNAVAIGRLDADETHDLAVVSSADVLSVVRNSNGMLLMPVSYATPGAPLGVAIGDLDHDGDNDIAVSNTSQDKVTLFMNDGFGTFTAAAPPLIAGTTPAKLVIADFDRDQYSDIAVVNRTSNTVRVYLGCPD
jgi:hypothetical protein